MGRKEQLYLSGLLGGYSQIPDSQWKRVTDLLTTRHLDTNAYFIMQGETPSCLAFIVSGIFRVFCITESGDEKILSFRTKGQAIAAYILPFLRINQPGIPSRPLNRVS